MITAEMLYRAFEATASSCAWIDEFNPSLTNVIIDGSFDFQAFAQRLQQDVEEAAFFAALDESERREIAAEGRHGAQA